MSNTIRLAHISDTHLGYRQLGKQDPVTGRNQRTVDFERAFEWAIGDIIAREPDALVHAGDVFHYSRPTYATIRHFVQQMQRVQDAGIPTIVIAGNHDTPRIRTGGSVYSILDLALPKIRFYAGYEQEHDYTTFQHLNMHVQAIPHGALTSDDPPVPSVVQGKINVMVIHGMVKGILKPGTHAEQGEEELDTSLLDRQFDYIALGHYHLHTQPPGVGNGWYAGSTERNGYGDIEATPGYCMVTLKGPGEGFEPVVHLDYPDTRPMIDLKQVYGDNMRGPEIADAVLERIRQSGHSNHELERAMVRAKIWRAERGDRREAESILKRELAGNIWNLSFAAEPVTLTLSESPTDITREFPDLLELFGEFVTSRTGPGFNEHFANQFRTRGSEAITAAQASAHQVAPEEDEIA